MLARVIALLVALQVLAPTSAHAQTVVLDISPTQRAGHIGQVLTYTGSITNTGGTSLFINGDSFELAGVGLTLDDTKFFNNFAGLLAAGQTIAGELFDVHIGSDALTGEYAGVFAVQGGADEGTFSTLHDKAFSVRVNDAPAPSAVPEGDSLALFAAGAAVLLVFQRRRSIAPVLAPEIPDA